MLTIILYSAVDIRELKLLSELNHPNIVRLVSVKGIRLVAFRE